MYLNKNAMLTRTETERGVGGCYFGDDYTSDQYSQPGNYSGYSLWDFPKHLWTLEDQVKANQEAMKSTERPHSLSDELLHEFTATGMNNCSMSTVNSSRASEPELVDLEAESENTSDLFTAEVRSKKVWKQLCPVCRINVYGGQERFDAHKLNNHYRKCKCGISFRYRSRLQEHINSEANVKEGKAKHGYLVPGMLKVKLVCDLCDMTFDTVEEGEKHRSSQHGIRQLESKSQSIKLRRSSKTESTEASSIAKTEMCHPPPSKKVKAAFQYGQAVPPAKAPLLPAFVQVAAVPSAPLVEVTFGPKGKAGPPPLLGDQVKYSKQTGPLSTGFQAKSLPKTGVEMTGSLRKVFEPLTGRDVQYLPQMGQPLAGVQLFGQQFGAPLTGFTANFAEQTELLLTGFTANSAQQLIELPLTGFTSNSAEQIRLPWTGFMANSKEQTELPLTGFIANSAQQLIELPLNGFTSNSAEQIRLPWTGFMANSEQQELELLLTGFKANSEEQTEVPLTGFTANSPQQEFELLLTGFKANPAQQFIDPPVTGFSASSGQQPQEEASITTAIPTTSRGQCQYQDVQAAQSIYQVHAPSPEFVQGVGLAEHSTNGGYPLIYCASPDIGDSTMTLEYHDVPVQIADELGRGDILEEADLHNLLECNSDVDNDGDEEYQLQEGLIAQLELLQKTWDETIDVCLFDLLPRCDSVENMQNQEPKKN